MHSSTCSSYRLVDLHLRKATTHVRRHRYRSVKINTFLAVSDFPISETADEGLSKPSSARLGWSREKIFLQCPVCTPD